MSPTTTSMPQATPRTFCGDSTPGNRRNKLRYMALLMLWALTFVGATFLIAGEHVSGVVAGIVTAVPALVALFAVLAYVRYLRGADELQRTIELNALAFAIGAGFVTWSAFQLVQWMGAPVEHWPDLPVLVMCAAYALGSVLSRMRYR